MPKVILRTVKLKTMGNLGASLSHTYRTRETFNADSKRFEQNTLERSPGDVLADLKSKLPENRRKDAVIAIEYMVSASPEWFEGKTRQQQDAYFELTRQWLIEKHGQSNVLDFSIHRDESSPHAIAYVIPLDDGRLNAKKWLGGRTTLSKMQTDFAERVGKPHGLERGIEGSKAKHITVKEFYAALNAEPVQPVNIRPKETEPQMLKKGIFTSSFESPTMVANRLTDKVQRHYSSALKQAQDATYSRRRELEWKDTAQGVDAQRQHVLERFKTLSHEFADLLELAQLCRPKYEQFKALAKRELAIEKDKAIALNLEEKEQKRTTMKKNQGREM